MIRQISNIQCQWMRMKKMMCLLEGLRRDETQPNTFNMWIVSDNLRKGAATNAVQIAEYCVRKDC